MVGRMTGPSCSSVGRPLGAAAQLVLEALPLFCALLGGFYTLPSFFMWEHVLPYHVKNKHCLLVPGSTINGSEQKGNLQVYVKTCVID